MPDLSFTAPSGELGGYLSQPTQEGPRPGVIVIQDALGLGDDIRAQADRLAAAGYLAFAPDLYSGRGIGCVLATLRASRAGRGAAYGDIEAARAMLAAREDSSGQIGIIGFCMGGGFALLCAAGGAFEAASVNYGEVPRAAAERLSGACPIVGSFGGRDWTLRGRAKRLEHALSESEVAHDVKEYPGAGHSFLNHLQVGPLTPLIPVLGFGYNEAAAEDAWRRILAFFALHLG